MKYFSKKLLGHEIFSFMVFWTTNLFSKKKKKKKEKKKNQYPLAPPPRNLMHAP